MKAYYVEFRLTENGDVLGIGLLARNKVDAYTTAVYEKIPELYGHSPYVAWVKSVTYASGKCKTFDVPYEGCNV